MEGIPRPKMSWGLVYGTVECESMRKCAAGGIGRIESGLVEVVEVSRFRGRAELPDW